MNKDRKTTEVASPLKRLVIWFSPCLILYMGSNIKRYRHGEMSPMVFYPYPSVLLQRDPKGSKEAKRPPPPLMIFISVFVWELRIDLNI